MEMADNKIRKITTLHFGELEVEPQYVFIFDNGLLGFENLREFVLISHDETAPFKWLISLEEPNIGFPLLSPWFVDLSYKPGRFYDPDKHALFAIVTLNNSDNSMSVNLKAPISLDVDNQTGEQVILPTDKYSPEFIIKGELKAEIVAE